jgi:hypothetical protein
MGSKKVTVTPVPWGDSDEDRVWQCLVRNNLATAAELRDLCDVPESLAQGLLNRIGTPREVFIREAEEKAMIENTLNTQVGGSHYKDMGVQPWQAMEAWLTPEEYRGYHKGVAIAYLARERQKGGIEDIKKAVHHLQRLVEMVEEPTC